jgi:serine/threonine protein kinase
VKNIFVYATSPQWWVKTGDFGITKRVAGEQTGLYTQTGTPLYRAPEISGFVDEDEDVYTNESMSEALSICATVDAALFQILRHLPLSASL